MSFWLIWVAWPKDTLAFGMGIMVGWPFLEKAVLEKEKKTQSGFSGLTFTVLRY